MSDSRDTLEREIDRVMIGSGYCTVCGVPDGAEHATGCSYLAEQLAAHPAIDDLPEPEYVPRDPFEPPY